MKFKKNFSLNIQQLLTWATITLQSAAEKIDQPRWEAEWLLLHVLQVKKDFLYAHPEKTLTNLQLVTFENFIERRLAAEPLAYILEEWQFRNLILKITPKTLIPRPETEQLIDIVSQAIDGAAKKMLDLGTGSGAIALTLAQENPLCEIWASDKDPTALGIAQENAQKYHLPIHFCLGDWYEAIKDEYFDIIISNPPYLAQGDSYLQQKSLQFEPLSALIAGPTGLEALCLLIREAPLHLKPKGLLFLEHGFEQSEAVCLLLQQHGFIEIETFEDNYGHKRFAKGMLRAGLKS